MNTQRHDEIGRKPLELDKRQVYYRRRDARLEGQILTARENRDHSLPFAIAIAVSLGVGVAALVAVWF